MIPSPDRPTANPHRRLSKKRIPDGTPCGYCFDEWAVTWDHLQPWSKNGLTIPENLYPSCQRCNSMLAAKSFPSIEEKREYARTTLIERGDWNPILEDSFALSFMSEALHENAENPTVLQPGMPQARMGRGSEEYGNMPDLPDRIRKEKTLAGVLQPKMPLARMATSKNRKHAMTSRQCHCCLKWFNPRHKKQLFCDKICKGSMGRIGNRVERRMREAIPIEVKRQLAEALILESSCPSQRCRRTARPGCTKCFGTGFVLTELGRHILLMIDHQQRPARR